MNSCASWRCHRYRSNFGGGRGAAADEQVGKVGGSGGLCPTFPRRVYFRSARFPTAGWSPGVQFQVARLFPERERTPQHQPPFSPPTPRHWEPHRDDSGISEIPHIPRIVPLRGKQIERGLMPVAPPHPTSHHLYPHHHHHHLLLEGRRKGNSWYRGGGGGLSQDNSSAMRGSGQLPL